MKWYSALKRHLKRFLVDQHINLPEESILQMATKSGMDRRRSARIVYPSVGAIGGLPNFSYKQSPLPAHDISVGGCSLQDPQNAIGPEVGQEIHLQLSWKERSDRVKARVVATTHLRKHFQFLDLNPDSLKVIQTQIDAGVAGQRLKQVQTEQNQSAPYLTAAEVWTAATGESLVFGINTKYFAELLYNGQVIQMGSVGRPAFINGTQVSRQTLCDIFVLLSNIKPQSHLVHQLLQNFAQSMPDWEGDQL